MKTECEAVFLFIAELTGEFKPGSGTVLDKIEKGQLGYINSTFHDLDLDNEEDRKDVHENIWLSRLYGELDRYFDIEGVECLKAARALTIDTEAYREDTYEWSVPIELDASALTE